MYSSPSMSARSGTEPSGSTRTISSTFLRWRPALPPSSLTLSATSIGSAPFRITTRRTLSDGEPLWIFSCRSGATPALLPFSAEAEVNDSVMKRTTTREVVAARTRLPQNPWRLPWLRTDRASLDMAPPDRQADGLSRPAGNPAVSERPVAFRPTLASGLAFTTGRPKKSKGGATSYSTHVQACAGFHNLLI